MDNSNTPPPEMGQVGQSTPGGPGDIFVSEALLAQKGHEYVRRLVRETYESAYRARTRARNRRD